MTKITVLDQSWPDSITVRVRSDVPEGVYEDANLDSAVLTILDSKDVPEAFKQGLRTYYWDKQMFENPERFNDPPEDFRMEDDEDLA